MALKEYVGAITLEVDSAEIEVVSLSVKEETGRRAVKVMNRKRVIGGFSKGVKTYELSITAVVPINGQALDWANIEGAKLTVDPDNGGQRISYLDCFATSVGEEFQAEGEARRSVTLMAVSKVEE